MKVTRVGVDIGKNSFHLCAVNRAGRVIWRKAIKRTQWLAHLELELDQGTEVGMEACGGAHHWARELVKRGFKVKLIAPQFVKPYVKSNKTDHADAEAIAEAMSRPEMRYVTVKTIQQQDIQALHRVRTELIKQRTATSNQIRGLASEYGLVAPQSPSQLRQAISIWLDNESDALSVLFTQLLLELREDLRHLDKRVAELDHHLRELAKTDPTAKRLQQLQGIGPVCATILSAALGDGSSFRNGREFAVSLGLVPKQHATGGKERLLGISKRGDSYIRKQMVHGARAALRHAKEKDDNLSRWLNGLSARKHANVVTVALAAKTARMAWALVRHELEYDPMKAAMSSN